MEVPNKCPDELRERATRMAVDARRDPAPRAGALPRIGKQMGINPETLRGSTRHPAARTRTHTAAGPARRVRAHSPETGGKGR